MPAIDSHLNGDLGDLRVLITGFGPFGPFEENPSWIAVRTLHNLILEMNVLDQSPKRIHITSVLVPTSYKDVLEIIPRLHARPPVLPAWVSETPTPPAEGYDFILHVGVAPPDKCRVESLAHKYGYDKPDANREFAPIVEIPADSRDLAKTSSEEERAEAERLKGYYKWQNDGKVRGFGSGYEEFDAEIVSDLGAGNLVDLLKAGGYQDVRLSLDAGRYLCDFIYYCSLAEQQRTIKATGTKSKASKVLFLHCPPIDQPLSTAQVVDCIKRLVILVSEKIITDRSN